MSLANYPSQISKLLDVNASTLVIQNSGTGGSNIPQIFAPATGQRMRVTLTPINVEPPAGTTYTSCADPCTVSINRNWGQQHLFAEIVDGSGNSLGKPIAHRILPQIELTASAPGAWTFPIEVIGQDRYVSRVQVTNPGSVRTNLRMELWLHNAGCSLPPYDTKVSIQVNGGAVTANDGNWIAVNNSAITHLDFNDRFGQWPQSNGSDDLVNGPIPQGAIGGAPQTLRVTVPIPDNLVTTSTNTIGFRSYCPDGRTSGYRVLHFNFQDTSTITQLDSVSVTSNVANMVAHAATVWATNEYWFLYRAPGMQDLFNGPRQVTKIDTTHATFTPCGGSVNTIKASGCTSPNGTYTVPTSTNPSIASATQPVMYAVREILSEPVAAWEEPTTWTAPVSGVAATGETLWKTGALVNPNLPYLNNAITVACADCHSFSGMDMKYHNFSNHSIEQRSYFHGLSQQDGLDIAAYIRGLSVTVPAVARPWNPPYQPCPGMDSLAVTAWGGGGGIGCILTYGNDVRPFMAPSGSYSTWAPDSRMNTHEIPIIWEYPSWFLWLPLVHPNDGFPGSNFAGSTPATAYDTMQAALTPGDFTVYGTATAGTYNLIDNTGLVAFKTTVQIPTNGISTNYPGYLPPSDFRARYYSLDLWENVKTWELIHENGLETMCSDVYTALYGATSSSPGYWDRCWYSGVPFNLAFHIAITGTNRNSLDSSLATYNYNSNAAYVLQMTINQGNRRQFGSQFLDIAYTQGFEVAGCQYFPCDYVGQYIDIVTAQGGWDWSLASGNYPFQGTLMRQFGAGMRYGLSFTDSTEITSLVTRIWADNLASVISAKGNTAAWTSWAGSAQSAGPCGAHAAGLAYSGGGTYCDSIAFATVMADYFSVASAKIDTIQSWAETTWPAHNFAQDRAANATGVVNISSGVLTWVSGSNFTNFGVDGSGSPTIASSLYIGSTRYPITVVTDSTHITVGNATSPPGGLPADGSNVTYTRCISAAPGGVAPSWPICGNMF
jgi:hypothetical protein